MNVGQAQADGYPVKMGSLPWPASPAWTLPLVISSPPTLLMLSTCSWPPRNQTLLPTCPCEGATHRPPVELSSQLLFLTPRPAALLWGRLSGWLATGHPGS